MVSGYAPQTQQQQNGSNPAAMAGAGAGNGSGGGVDGSASGGRASSDGSGVATAAADDDDDGGGAYAGAAQRVVPPAVEVRCRDPARRPGTVEVAYAFRYGIRRFGLRDTLVVKGGRIVRLRRSRGGGSGGA
jgi:hypothetical protein